MLLVSGSLQQITYDELEQANVDWLFGCNPWGTSMVYGLAAMGRYTCRSAFVHLRILKIILSMADWWMALYMEASIKNLIGITLYQPDEYALSKRACGVP